MAIYETADGNRIIADQDFIDANCPDAKLIDVPVIEEVKATRQQPILLNEKQIAVLTAAGLL